MTVKNSRFQSFKIPFYFVKQYIFWILFFAINRFIFYLFNLSSSRNVEFTEILKSFWHALYLDTSMTSYFLIIPFLILFFQSVFRNNFLNTINRFYTYVIIFFVSIIYISELGIYREWNEKISMKAVSFLANPDEVFNTAGIYQIFLGFIFLLFISAVGIFFYNKIIYEKIFIIKRNIWFSIIWFLLMPGIILLGMRGGLKVFPISQGSVYFSKSNYVNLGTVNTVWNLMHSFTHNFKYKNKNPFIYYSFDEAEAVVSEMYSVEKDTTVKILNRKKPNIILIMLESWSADMVETLGGYEGVTPNFNKMSDEGLFFVNNYSNCSLSHQSMVAIYSSFPVMPEVDIIKHPDKYENLNCFPKKINDYYTAFYYGGNLHHGNIKSYLYFNEFDKIFELSDFPSDAKRGNLGVHDEVLFEKLLTDIDNFKEPFFCGTFTLSSHSPYDFPMKKHFDWGGNYNSYINSLYYSDKCLGQFFEEAKKRKWYENTLFVLVADHSRSTPQHSNFYETGKRRSPMLFYGNVLKKEFVGKKYDKFSTQMDIAPTILAQLNIGFQEFKWGKNLFNPYNKNFICYGFDFGFGLVIPNNYLIYDEKNNIGIYDYKTESEQKKQELLKIGKSFTQVLFQEFLDY